MVGPGGLNGQGLDGHDSAVVVLGQANKAGLGVVGGAGVGGAVAVAGHGGGGGGQGGDNGDLKNNKIPLIQYLVIDHFYERIFSCLESDCVAWCVIQSF